MNNIDSIANHFKQQTIEEILNLINKKIFEELNYYDEQKCEYDKDADKFIYRYNDNKFLSCIRNRKHKIINSLLTKYNSRDIKNVSSLYDKIIEEFRPITFKDVIKTIDNIFPIVSLVEACRKIPFPRCDGIN